MVQNLQKVENGGLYIQKNIITNQQHLKKNINWKEIIKKENKLKLIIY